MPRNCDPENGTCEYSAKWDYLPRGDEIKFTITTTNTDTWTGIAFSNDDKMVRLKLYINSYNKNNFVFYRFSLKLMPY